LKQSEKRPIDKRQSADIEKRSSRTHIFSRHIAQIDELALASPCTFRQSPGSSWALSLQRRSGSPWCPSISPVVYTINTFSMLQ